MTRPWIDDAFNRRALVLTAGAAGGQVILFGAAPILTRLYDPADFGLLGIYAAVLSVIVVAANLRYELTIPLPESEHEARGLLTVALASGALVSSVCLVAVFLFQIFVEENSSIFGSVRAYLWFFPVAVLFAATYQALSFWAIRQAAFKPLARTRLAQGLGQAVAQIAFGVAGLGTGGLIVGDVVGRSLGAGTLASIAGPHAPGLPRHAFSDLRRLARRYRGFAALGAPAALLNAITLQLPSLYLALIYGVGVAGLFTLVQRLLLTPIALVTSAITQVYLFESVKAGAASSRQTRLLWKTISKMAILGIPILSLSFFDLASVFAHVFGARWGVASDYVRLLAPMYFLNLVVTPVGAILDVRERQGLHLIRELIRLALLMAAGIAAATLHWSPLGAVGLISSAGVVSYVFYLGVSVATARHPTKHVTRADSLSGFQDHGE